MKKVLYFFFAVALIAFARADEGASEVPGTASSSETKPSDPTAPAKSAGSAMTDQIGSTAPKFANPANSFKPMIFGFMEEGKKNAKNMMDIGEGMAHKAFDLFMP